MKDGVHFELKSRIVAYEERACAREDWYIETQNYPIVSVSSVVNSTTGEEYVVESMQKNEIVISGSVAPAKADVENELCSVFDKRTIQLQNTFISSITDAYYLDGETQVSLKVQILNRFEGTLIVVPEVGSVFNPDIPVYVSYSYSSDNITVSYEHHRNVIDWTIAGDQYIPANQLYFVGYRFGSRYNALLEKFGYLLDITDPDEIAQAIKELDKREVYRKLLKEIGAAYLRGPTLASVKRIVRAISGVDPIIQEGYNSSFTLGQDYLYPTVEEIGTLSYASGKFGKGVLISRENTVGIIAPGLRLGAPGSIALDKGTLQTWILPRWRQDTYDHYIFDLGSAEESLTNRMSLYKGFDGYLYFDVRGYDGTLVRIRHDISGLEEDGYGDPTGYAWVDNDSHLISAQWEQRADSFGTIYTHLSLFIDREDAAGELATPVATAVGATHIDSIAKFCTIGCDINIENQVDSILDDFRIVGLMRNVAKIYNDFALEDPFLPHDIDANGRERGSANTYMLFHFDENLNNEALTPLLPGSTYEYADGQFNQGIVLSDSALVIDVG